MFHSPNRSRGSARVSCCPSTQASGSKSTSGEARSQSRKRSWKKGKNNRSHAQMDFCELEGVPTWMLCARPVAGASERRIWGCWGWKGEGRSARFEWKGGAADW